MSRAKVWYCVNCGYETEHRGRCHRCRERLEASPLPELEPAEDEQDEVGYRVEDWADAERGRLIVALIRAHVLHRFEDDELVVNARDEEKVDGLLSDLREVFAGEVAGPTGGGGEADFEDDDLDEGFDEDFDEDLGGEDAGARPERVATRDADPTWSAVRGLHAAALRLREDPTDMQADADVAEFSAGVFATDRFRSVDADTWAAVGRVTRRLLGALGADEALEDEIRTQAGVLVKLLQPTVDPAAAEENRLVRSNGSGTHAVGEVGTAGEEAAPFPTQVSEEEARSSEQADDEHIESPETVGQESEASWVPVTDDESEELTAEAEQAERVGDRRGAKGLRRQARERLRLRRLGRGRSSPGTAGDVDEVIGGEQPAAAQEGVEDEESLVSDEPAADLDAEADDERGGEQRVGDQDGEEEEDEDSIEAETVPSAGESDAAAEVVYELPDWLPEQRANLSVMLDADGIAHDWDGGNLVVAGDREAETDAVFERIEGAEGVGEDDEARYRTLEELFAAADRLAKDPTDEDRRGDARNAIAAADGATPVGMDDVMWWQIRSRARSLLEALETGAGPARVAELATVVRDRLRTVV